MKFLFSLFLLVVGIVIGFSAKYLLPDIIPTNITVTEEKAGPIKGEIVAKELKESSLLLTIDTDKGAVLATFNRKVDEINLLANIGDSIELAPRRYEPFMNDPRIRRVTKGRKGVQSSREESAVSEVLRSGALKMPSAKDAESGGDTEPGKSGVSVHIEKDPTGQPGE